MRIFASPNVFSREQILIIRIFRPLSWSGWVDHCKIKIPYPTNIMLLFTRILTCISLIFHRCIRSNSCHKSWHYLQKLVQHNVEPVYISKTISLHTKIFFCLTTILIAHVKRKGLLFRFAFKSDKAWNRTPLAWICHFRCCDAI